MKVDEHTKRLSRPQRFQFGEHECKTHKTQPTVMMIHQGSTPFVLHRTYAVSLNWRHVWCSSLICFRVVSPRSSATGWECWVWVSCRTPPSSCPRRWDQKARGRNKAAGNLHEVLAMRQRGRFHLFPQLPRAWLRQVWPKSRLVLNWGKHISIFSFSWLTNMFLNSILVHVSFKLPLAEHLRATSQNTRPNEYISARLNDSKQRVLIVSSRISGAMYLQRAEWLEPNSTKRRALQNILKWFWVALLVVVSFPSEFESCESGGA